MTTQTKKSPGRPKKVQPVAETPAAPPTAPKKVSLPFEEREDQLKQRVRNSKKRWRCLFASTKGVTVYDQERDTVRRFVTV